MTQELVETFLREVSGWAQSRADILAVGLVGSQARGTAGPHSDVDLVILACDLQFCLKDTAWAALFGVLERQRAEDYGRVQSLRVWYRGGLEVEFGWADAGWAALPMDPGTRRVVADGLRVLWERQPLLSRLLTAD